MDWKWFVVGAMAAVAAFFVIKYCMLRRNVKEFAAQMEECLDQVIAGDTVEPEKMQDTLFAKLQEKLYRVEHIFALREKKNQKEKETLQELISDISHQSRIPIANQNIYLDMLREEVCSCDGKQALTGMENQTRRLQFLMESMIKLSRMETGVIQIKKQRHDIMDTVRLAVTGIVTAAVQKEISLFVDGPSALCVLHDRKWTTEAVGNILDNAVKYTPAGGTVRIQVKQMEIFTVIEISDTGKGIPLNRQAQIFRRFYREPEVHDSEGIGVGLYLARKIIELQEGYIDVVSAPGEGACFRLHLQNQ